METLEPFIRVVPKKIVRATTNDGYRVKTVFGTGRYEKDEDCCIYISQRFLRPAIQSLYFGEVIIKTYKDMNLVEKVIAIKPSTLDEYYNHLLKFENNQL